MNKTMIAMAVALLAGLAPVPTTAGGGLNECIQPIADKAADAAGGAVRTVEELLAPTTSAANAEVTCLGQTDCEAVLQSLLVSGTIDEEGLCDPKLEPCPPGKVGMGVSGTEACVLVPDPTLGKCPEKEVGLVLGKAEACVSPQGVESPQLPSVGRDGPKDPNCARSEDDPGFGGTHVTCRYACWEFDELAIGVTAMDKDAGAHGYTTCGGQDASCNLPTPACTGVSPGLTTRREQDQPCDGFSEEFNSSPTTVYCLSVGAGTGKNVLCRIDDIFCNLGPGATSSTAVATPSSVCPVASLGMSAFADLETLVAAVSPDTTRISFVAFTFDPLGGVALRYQSIAGDAAQSWCTFEEFAF